MSLKEELIKVAHSYLKEGRESSKEMIAQNTTVFEDMGMANSNPGEFAPEEITDHENLVNTAKMSNDTDFENKVDNCNCEDAAVELTITTEEEPTLEDLVNLGKENKKFHRIADILESVLTESDYAGNLAYNPDKRLNASDILNAVKNAVDPELAPKLSVNKDVDANEEPSYIILNIDEKDLPEKIEIDTNTDKKVVLKRDGKAYKFDK